MRNRIAVDYSLDRIGERLDNPEAEPMLSQDDYLRLKWIQEKWEDAYRLIDVGASDGGITERFVRRSTQHESIVIEPHAGQRDKLLARLWPFRDRVVFCFSTLEHAIAKIDGQWADVVLVGEVIEHLEPHIADDFLREICACGLCRVVITVPNKNAKRYDLQGRSRWQWPDHKQHFTDVTLGLMLARHFTHVDIEPIVGTLDESIWLGAVCRA